MASRIVLRNGRYVRAFGSDAENIVCPAGTSVNGDAQGNVWCEDAAGKRVASATFTPAPASQPLAQQAGLGIAGIGIVIAGALLLASVVLTKGRGR